MVDVDITVEEIEERLFGQDTTEECKVILEVFGVDDKMEKTFIDEANSRFDNIEITTGLPTEIEFKNKRVEFSEIKNFTFFLEELKANQIAGNPLTFIELKRLVEKGNVQELIEQIGPDAGFQAMKEIQFFLKPLSNIQRAQTMVPRPKLAFEAKYNVPREVDLRDVKGDFRELLDKGLMGNIGEIEIIEDRDTIIVVPLKTSFDVDEFSSLDFNFSGLAEEVAEDITGTEIKRSPRLERLILTCTQVGG